MVMPTPQRCPECRELFIGSDCIGDLCPSCQMERVFNVPFVFWRCPDHQSGGPVDWEQTENGMVATCGQCGRKSEPKKGGAA